MQICRFFFIDQAFFKKDNEGMNKISENLIFINGRSCD